MTEPIRTLILEDNPADAELVQFELEEAGLTFTPKVVVTEEDFVQSLQNFCPDLILSDYDLPKYNGSLALIEAKRTCPDTPFILVTGAVTEDRAIDILTQGAKDYVLKNRLQQRLAPAVRRALAEAEEHRARKQAEAELREAHRTLEERVKIRTAELEAEVAARKKLEKEREHLSAEVENRAAELEATIASMATGLIVYNAAGNATRMNNAAKELLPQEIFFSTTVEERARVIRWETEEGQPFPPEEIPVARALRGETTHNVIVAAFFPDRKLWISASAAPIRTSDGQMLGVVASFIDITKRRQMEEMLRENEQRFRALVTASSEVLYRMSPDWSEMRQLNSRGFLANTEKPNRNWLQEYIHPDDQPHVNAVIGDAIRAKSMFELEHRVRRADGSIGWTHSRAVPLMDKNGEIVEWFGTASDITERKRAEMALQEQA